MFIKKFWTQLDIESKRVKFKTQFQFESNENFAFQFEVYISHEINTKYIFNGPNNVKIREKNDSILFLYI